MTNAYDNCSISACQRDQDCKQLMLCMSDYRKEVLEEAAQECDELAKIAMTDEFSIGGCIVTKVAAKMLAGNIRALKGTGNETVD